MAGLTTSHAVRPLSAAERKRVSLLNPERAFSKVISTQAKCRSRKSLKVLKVSAIGPGPAEKKTLKREEEPDDYWQSEAEKRGDSPFKDPLAIIGIVAILFPFIFVLIAIAFGVIDVNGGR